MKRFYKAFKSKKLSLGSIRGPEQPATSTPTSTAQANLMPSVPACDSDANTSAQVTSGASSGGVSVQRCPSHL